MSAEREGDGERAERYVRRVCGCACVCARTCACVRANEKSVSVDERICELLQ